MGNPDAEAQQQRRDLLKTIPEHCIEGRETRNWVRGLTFGANNPGRWASIIHEIHYDSRSFNPESYLFGRYQKGKVTVGQDGKIIIGPIAPMAGSKSLRVA
ncbi:hypothetical protein H2199_004764 [Coniosporium tulheliwenetii]|uniref:Uncharacterized protein n=1 Tax=Coniosporium tulheliwenetii TaxID=3383036 RepID=A0ACC2Z3U8_9PEZI|nr:hypothetical protein H2199_004764 [Cladosporium sp. JES 115]